MPLPRHRNTKQLTRGMAAARELEYHRYYGQNAGTYAHHYATGFDDGAEEANTHYVARLFDTVEAITRLGLESSNGS